MSDYREAAWNLRFSAKDAEDVALRLLREKDGLYRDVLPTYLPDGEARRLKIIRALAEMERAVESIDVAVFFFSGHGCLSGGD